MGPALRVFCTPQNWGIPGPRNTLARIMVEICVLEAGVRVSLQLAMLISGCAVRRYCNIFKGMAIYLKRVEAYNSLSSRHWLCAGVCRGLSLSYFACKLSRHALFHLIYLFI